MKLKSERQFHIPKMALPSEVDSSTLELLDGQTHVWNHIFHFTNSMTLKCAIQLGIPDAIHKHGKPMTLSELADALPINKAKSDGLYRLMRILVHSKFFDKVKKSEDEEEAYSLTRVSRLLLRDEPLSIAPFALAMLDPVLLDPYHHMAEWFQDELPSPFFTKHGKNLWEYAGEDQRWNQSFNEGMACDAGFATSILTKHCKQVFEGLETMVDVGGGTGAVAKAVADAFPGLKCIVLDLPQVVDGMEGFENLRYVGGDMFESIPQADAVFLKWIFHDWPYEESIKLLRKCKEAIIPSGKVIIVDMVVDYKNENRKATETQFFFDMMMMTDATGIERTEKDWAKLFFDAGFKSYKINHVLGLRSVIEVFP
ncbi:hypothetical protein ACS0TY_017427 [Phlomoides rotata]